MRATLKDLTPDTGLGSWLVGWLGLGSWGRRGDWVLGLEVSQRAGSWVLGLGAAGGRIFASELLEKQKKIVMELGKIAKFFHFCLKTNSTVPAEPSFLWYNIGSASDVGY